MIYLKYFLGTGGGRISPEYIVSNTSPNIKKLKKWAVAYSKPIVVVKDEKHVDRINPNKRERKEGDLIRKIKEEIER